MAAFDIILAAVMGWYFEKKSSVGRWVSFGLSLLFMLYLLCYELYIFYRLIHFAYTDINTHKFL